MKWNTIVVLLLFCVNLSRAGELLRISCERKTDLRASSTQDQPFISLVENGCSGNCFQIRCPADRKSILFHLWTQPRIRVESASDKVRISIWVKGKGSGTFGFLSYTDVPAIFYPAGTSRTFSVDTGGQWEKLEMLYTPKAGSDYANQIFLVMPCMSIVASSDLHIDDFELELVSPPTRIIIED
ncbi:MAG: hypothetical protein WCT05_01005 [Lentisphaeria bacterium]